MDFIYAERYFRKGKEIIESFKQEGLTISKADSIMRLYARDISYQELKGAVGIRNPGQFSRDVIMPLIKENYIEKTIPERKIRLTQKGKRLVERALSKV